MFETIKGLDSGAGSTLGDYKFLYGFVSLIRPKNIVEIGTNRGVSAIAMAMALRDGNLTESKIMSIDTNADILEIAKEQLEQMGLSKYVTLVFGDSSMFENYPSIDMATYVTLFPFFKSKVKTCPPFDMAFLDGSHTCEGVLKDFNNLKSRATYLLIHDATGNPNVRDAINTIADTKKYDVFNIDVGNGGFQWRLNKIVFSSYPGFTMIKAKRGDYSGN